MVYEQLKIAGSSMANLRITENSINRANEIDDVPVMDEKGRTITPDSHNIQFHDVTFSYEKRPVLKSVSLTIPDKSLTAIVGPSGSGDSDIMMTDTINPLKSKFKGFHKTFKQDDLGLSLSSFLLN